MKRMAGALLGALVAVCTSTAAGAAEDCELHQLATLKMRELADGSLAVPVELAGQPAELMVSISDPFSFLLASYSDPAGFDRKEIPQAVKVHVGGKVMADEVTVPRFAVGRASGSDLHFVRAEGVALPDPKVAGELAMDILASFDVDLDFANNTLNLYSHDHCEGQVVYWASSYADVPYETDVSGHPMIKMALDGKAVIVAFTMDRTSALMGMTEANRLFGLKESSPGMSLLSQGTADHPRLYRYPFLSLSVDGVTIRNPAIAIYPDTPDEECRPKIDLSGRRTFCLGGSDVTLGLAELRRLHIYLATKEKVIYVTAAGGTVQSAAAPTASK